MPAELFAANPLEIDDDLLEKGPYGRHSTVGAKSLTLVNIASLGRILGVDAPLRFTWAAAV